jgi:hypothetical protein
LLGAALLCAPARADDDAQREARALFAEGIQKSDAGDFVGALDRFRAAYARFPSVKILLNIGTMLRQLGRNAEAADAYDAYLRDPAADPAKKAEVEALLKDLDARVAKLHVLVDDRAAVVRLDGKVVGQPGGVPQMRIEPGPHAVTADRDGAPPAVATVTAVAGQDASVSLHIALPAGGPADTPPPPPTTPPTPAPPIAPAAVVAPAPEHDVPSSPPPSLSHRGQFGAVLRADANVQVPGLVAAPGLAYGIGDYVEVATCALLGKSKGVEPGVTVLLLKGAWKPRLSAAVPIFVVDGVHPGVRAAAGVEWDPIRHFGVFVDAGVAAFPDAPVGFQKVVFVPSVGVEPRL